MEFISIVFVFLFFIITSHCVECSMFFKLYWRTNKILPGLFYTLIIGLLVYCLRHIQSNSKKIMVQ